MDEYAKSILSEALLDPSEELFQARIDAINEYSKEDKGLLNKSFQLIRYLFYLDVEDNYITEFREIIISYDREFPSEGRIIELRSLIEIALVTIINSKSFGILLAQTVVNCYCEGLRRKPRGSRIVDYSKFFLTQQASSSRVTNYLQRMKRIKLVKQTLIDEMQESVNSQPGSVPALSEKIEKIFNDINSGFTDLIDQTNTMIDLQNDKNSVLQEESNILWWLISPVSKELKSAWSKTDYSQGCLAIGSELSNQIETDTGPLSFQEIIKKKTFELPDPIKTTTLKTIIDKSSNIWKHLIREKNKVPPNDLTPVHCLLDKSVDLLDLTSYSKQLGVSLDKRISPISIAYQLYNEGLFIRTLSLLENMNE